jgi:hypothetical protein
VKNNHIAHPNKMCIHTNKKNKTRKKIPIAFGNAKETKQNKKQITKAFLNASPQTHKTKQNQNIPNQPKTTNKAFLNALIHKYKQKNKNNENPPISTKSKHTKTNNQQTNKNKKSTL